MPLRRDTICTVLRTARSRGEGRGWWIQTSALPLERAAVSAQFHPALDEERRVKADVGFSADGRIAPRSGLAVKNFIDTGAGVIDADYRGPVKVLLFNHSEVDFAVKEGDRIAQLVIERIRTPEVVVVDDLEDSVRGAGGFGSTG